MRDASDMRTDFYMDVLRFILEAEGLTNLLDATARLCEEKAEKETDFDQCNLWEWRGMVVQKCANRVEHFATEATNKGESK